MFFKPKKNLRPKLRLLLAPSLLISFSVLAATQACGYRIPFYNFENYMGPRGRAIIDKNFEYREFGDASDFEDLVKDNKTSGGIVDMPAAVSLVQQGYLEKIDYSKIFPNIPDMNDVGYETAVENLFSSLSLKFMRFYDDKGYFPPGDHLWDYCVPYFAQDRVIAYNIHRGGRPGKELDFPDRSWQGILKTLSENGYSNIRITNSKRDNMLYGSSIGSPSGTMDGVVTASNYKSQINNFINTVNQNFGGNKHIYLTDGTQVLQSIIDPNQNADSAILYNGDALDAYYANRNFSSLVDGNDIRVVTPTQTSYVLDGMVIVKQSFSHLSNATVDLLYNTLYDAIYQGGEDTGKANEPLTNNSSAIYQNFSFVRYTPTFQGPLSLAESDLFKNDSNLNTVDGYAWSKIFSIAEGSMNENNVPMPISPELQALINTYYNTAIQN